MSPKCTLFWFSHVLPADIGTRFFSRDAPGSFSDSFVTMSTLRGVDSMLGSSGSRWGAEGAMAPRYGPVKTSHKKMAAKGGRIDFMFLGPPYPAAGSDAGWASVQPRATAQNLVLGH